MSESCVLYFVKYPESGKVKTRLGEVLGNDKAALMYRHFVQDMLRGLTRLHADLRICYVPGDSDLPERFKAWLGPQHSYYAQQGLDLGERMKQAMQQAFDDGYDRVVLMGSDIPDFPFELVQKTLNDLQHYDAAIGPAFDGGYYLIGFRKEYFRPEVFDGIRWGESDVYQPTVEKMRKARLEVQFLPDWNDVDTIWDLNVLYRTNKNSSFRKSSTFALLRENDALIRQYDIDLPGFAMNDKE
ncbi:TIGR04282 family arsenosugar biosynthesis glycosyltransferase [Oleidesulfovibrio sp.]|uniref:TIGR04282 family arsenosugar biosynthesis glycosyltransferase n=1 Tax=Oleidesulfovibrio sp. TaxID=2909707 RepID=UPI003A86E4A9